MNENTDPALTPNQATDLEKLSGGMPAPSNQVAMYGLADAGYFAQLQRVAKLFCNSLLVPENFRGEKNLPNTVIALDMANRMQTNPLAIMQSMYIVHGKPGWESKFVIACINTCGKFSPLRFVMENLGEKEVPYSYTIYVDGNKQRKEGKVKIRDQRCVAWATEKATGERLESPPVTVEMAVKEGWYTKSDSKWQTMQELMLSYRTATLFGRLYSPELMMGMKTVEEIIDIEAEIMPSARTEPAGLVYGKKSDAAKPAVSTTTVEAPPKDKEAAKEPLKEVPPDYTALPRPEMDKLITDLMAKDSVTNEQIVAYARAGRLCGPKIEEPGQFRDETALHILNKWAEILPSIKAQKV